MSAVRLLTEKKSENCLRGPQESPTLGLREGENDTDPGQDDKGEHMVRVRGRVLNMELIEAKAYRDLNWNFRPAFTWH